MRLLGIIIKYVFILSPFAAIGVLVFGLYGQTSSEVQFYLSESPNKTLAELVAIAEEGVPINPDPYASSTYLPGDELYEAISLAQKRYTRDASNLLRKLAAKGNVDAMYFLADLSNDAALFIEAAELGNPYAAIRLDTNGYHCLRYMTRYCDSKWGKQARPILRARAAQGDAKAGYALYLNLSSEKPSLGYIFNRAEYTASGQGAFQILLKAAKDGIKQHYYKPLRELLSLYRRRASLIPFNDEKMPLTDEEELTLVKIAKIAANDNDMVTIGAYPDAPWALEATKRIIDFVGLSYRSLAFDYLTLMGKNDRSYIVEGYVRALVYAHLFMQKMKEMLFMCGSTKIFLKKKKYLFCQNKKKHRRVY